MDNEHRYSQQAVAGHGETAGAGHGEPADTGQFWEQHYRGRERIWSGRVNAVLAEVAASLPVGSALDLGCGEGADAVWLAERGWQVTAVDVSAVALARAGVAAAAAGVVDRVVLQQLDLERDPLEGSFDLVSAQFLQSPIAFARERVLRAAAGCVAPGGLLLVVEHAAAPPWAGAHHHDVVFPTPAQTLAAIGPPEGWVTERLDVTERTATAPDGRTGTVLDGVIAVRRMST